VLLKLENVIWQFMYCDALHYNGQPKIFVMKQRVVNAVV